MKFNLILRLVSEMVILAFYFHLRLTDKIFLENLQVENEIRSILNFLIFYVLIDFTISMFKLLYTRSTYMNPWQKDSVIFGVENLAKLMIGIALIIAVFGWFGVNLDTLLTSLSIVAAAIAIISKEFVNDFLIGLYLSFSKDFRIGDYVKIGDNKGKILEIGMQKVRFLNEDDDVVIIPHSKIYNTEMINYTKRDIRLASVDFEVDINAIGNIELFEKELVTSLAEFENYIEPESYNLRVMEIKKDYIDFKFQYKIKKLDRNIQREIRKQTVREVFNYISQKMSEHEEEIVEELEKKEEVGH